MTGGGGDTLAATTFGIAGQVVTITLGAGVTAGAPAAATITIRGVVASNIAGAAMPINLVTSKDTTAVTTQTLQVVAAAANRFASVASINKTSIVADGVDTATVTVFLFDQFFNPVAAPLPAGASSRNTVPAVLTDTIAAATPTAGQPGRFTFTVASNIPGTARIGVTADVTAPNITDLENHLKGVAGATADLADMIAAFDVTFTAPAVTVRGDNAADVITLSLIHI